MSDHPQPHRMDGAVIGITAARRAAEQTRLVEALGGVGMVGPTLDLDRPASDDVIASSIAAVIAHPPEVAVVMTGIGARHIFGVAERTGRGAELREALAGCRVLARGGKAQRALRELGREADWTAHPPEAATVRDALMATPLAGVRVVVQCAGPDPEALLAPLRAAGADVVPVFPYVVRAPEDVAAGLALVRAAVEGRVAAVTFTSAHAVDGFVELAERDGLEPADVPRAVLVTAVGAVTAAALRGAGMRVDVVPDTPKMGAMYHALAAALAARRGAQPAGGTG